MIKSFNILDVEKSYYRIKNFIKKTPIYTNQEFDKIFNAQVFFKCENFQETNSFKARGAFNSIISYKEKNGFFPKKIVAISSGNHAQAVAFACKKFGIKALIFMAKNASKFKIAATKNYGAEVVVCETRQEADFMAQEKSQKEGYFFIHPSASAEVILGQATCCFEAFEEIGEVDAVFTPVGGGGLASGALIASKNFSDKIKVFGCEPEIANDAAISVRENKIFSFTKNPQTIADGARTMQVSPICFSYLKQLENIFEISEDEIKFWCAEFFKLSNIKIEPTSALAIAGAKKYCDSVNYEQKKILIIVSGGNV